MNQNEPPILAIRNLRKRSGFKTLIQDVSMTVPRWSVYGLLGANGAGKSTALKILCGALRQTSGSITLFGKPWNRFSLSQVWAVIEQSNVYAANTGYENLKIHGLISWVPNLERRIKEVLEIVGLSVDASHKIAGKYSLWMKQRLAIGMAIIHRPKLLVLDEPTNGLDIEWVRSIREFISRLSAEETTVIISSHALVEIERLCTHLGIIVEWKTVFDGSKSELVSDGEDIEDRYLSLVNSKPCS